MRISSRLGFFAPLFPPVSDPLPRHRYSGLFGLVLFAACVSASPVTHAGPRGDTAADLPRAGREAIGRALEAVDCAIRSGQAPAQRLTVIDYRLPSHRPRLWVLDLATGKLLFEELVAHGRGSGEARAVRFSNVENSYSSSLGLYRTLGTYDGENGYSLRLEGLEPGFNDRAWSRSIVMHGADYVSSAFIRAVGRLGRSHGCPAVRREVAKPLIDSIKEGQYLFAYYPDAAWLADSSFFGCTNAGVVKAGARANGNERPASQQESNSPRGVAD